MIDVGNGRIARRQVLAGAGAAGLLLLMPGWALAADSSRVEAARRLMRVATTRAFAKLSAPNGFWDSPVARFDLPELFLKGRAPLSPASRDQLQHRLNLVAEAGARRAGQVARVTSGVIKREDADAIIAGDATAGTSVLRARVGARMINEMIPAIERALRAERDPIVIAAVGRLSGVELRDVAKAVALKADSAIWYQIGAEEGDIRTNPQNTGDAVLIGALRK